MNPRTIAGPVPGLDPALAYRRPTPAGPVTLKLDANEGPSPAIEPMLEALRREGAELLRRYPDAAPLEQALARRFGIHPAQVLVTAGGDEAIDRCCRAFLAPGRSLLLPEPTFEMFGRYARLARGETVSVPWLPGPFPVAGVLDRIDRRAALVAVVSPNNPTGEVATPDDLRRISAAAPRALVLLDAAYAEYTEADLTGAALALPNVVVIRTFSKARGLAGCRVGYVMGPADIIAALRAAAGPYPVAAPAIALAAAQLEQGEMAMTAHVERVRAEREELSRRLQRWGVPPRRSQANFVYAEFGPLASRIHAELASNGILVRYFPGALRITLPGEPEAFARLVTALEIAVASARVAP